MGSNLNLKSESSLYHVATGSYSSALLTFDRWGAGGDASIEELESAGTRDPKWLIDRANLFLQAGAYVCPNENRGAPSCLTIFTDDHDRE